MRFGRSSSSRADSWRLEIRRYQSSHHHSLTPIDIMPNENSWQYMSIYHIASASTFFEAFICFISSNITNNLYWICSSIAICKRPHWQISAMRRFLGRSPLLIVPPTVKVCELTTEMSSFCVYLMAARRVSPYYLYIIIIFKEYQLSPIAYKRRTSRILQPPARWRYAI